MVAGVGNCSGDNGKWIREKLFLSIHKNGVGSVYSAFDLQKMWNYVEWHGILFVLMWMLAKFCRNVSKKAF